MRISAIEEVHCNPEKELYSSALVPVSSSLMIPDNLPALKKSEKPMSIEMETLFRNFQQF